MTGHTLPRAAILTIGDELLKGERVDTNAAWLARHLTRSGFRVTEVVSVGDPPEEIRHGLREARAVVGEGGLVVATGGLGPTLDDRTRDAVAEEFGRELVEDPELLAELEARFRSRGFDALPTPNRRVARVPEGARLLPNREGTAPGLVLEEAGIMVVLLPGVPAEMRHLVEGPFREVLEERFQGRGGAGVPVVRSIRTTGIPESALAERIEDLLSDTGAVNLASLPSVLGVELVVSATGPDAQRSVEEMMDTLLRRLEPWVYDAPSGDLAEAVLLRMRASGWTVAMAESCTAGLVSKRLTDHPGASEVFLGGVVAYSNTAKEALLGVPEALLREHGAVSAEVARAMARGACRRFGADAAVGITGIAGPGGGSETKPVGTVAIWTVTPHGETGGVERFPGGREEIRARAAQHALHGLLQVASNPWARDG